MTTTSSLTLIDTNVLVYAVFPAAAHHAPSRALLDLAKVAGAGLCVAPQNLVEFFSVVINPKRVTHPKTGDEALQAVDDLIALPGLTVLPVPVDVLSRWTGLLRHSAPSQKRAFDAFLAATMLGNGVTTICTYNTADFAHFPGVQPRTP